MLFAFLCGCATSAPPALRALGDQLSDAERDRIHVIFVNSPIDPLRFGGVSSLVARLRSAGFANSDFRAWASGSALAREVRRLRADDADANVMLVGWSGGSLWVWDALNELESEHIRVDRIVYMDSNWIKGRVEERGHPDNAGRALLIYRSNNPPVTGVPRASSVVVPTTSHLAVPGHEATAEAIVRELLSLAQATKTQRE